MPRRSPVAAKGTVVLGKSPCEPSAPNELNVALYPYAHTPAGIVRRGWN
jgi:hypothetical protein